MTQQTNLISNYNSKPTLTVTVSWTVKQNLTPPLPVNIHTTSTTFQHVLHVSHVHLHQHVLLHASNVWHVNIDSSVETERQSSATFFKCIHLLHTRRQSVKQNYMLTATWSTYRKMCVVSFNTLCHHLQCYRFIVWSRSRQLLQSLIHMYACILTTDSEICTCTCTLVDDGYRKHSLMTCPYLPCNSQDVSENCCQKERQQQGLVTNSVNWQFTEFTEATNVIHWWHK